MDLLLGATTTRAFLIYERNGTVLHLGRRIAFGMYVDISLV